MNNRKVIFLDVDGVLNGGIADSYAPSGCVGVDINKVMLLKHIINATGADIVLSSSWKQEFPDEGFTTEDGIYLVERLAEYSVEIYDITVPGKATAYRGGEIQSWLSRHPEISGWVVLDDEVFCDFESCGIMSHLVQTDCGKGMTIKDVRQAIEVLNKDCD